MEVAADNFYPTYKGHFDLTQSAVSAGASAGPDAPLKVRRRSRPSRRKPPH
jgi:hypothetical protein